MDPLLLLPPEVVQQIWVQLKPRDLLACRAVAPHWLESVTSCDEAWFTEFSYDWHEFFEMKKTLRRWCSKKLRRNSFSRIEECVFSDDAFYLLFLDGILEMHSPCGRLVRRHENKASALYKGDNCLMIVVDGDQKAGESPAHDTIITDFVLNEIEKWTDIRVTAASPKGFAFIRNGYWFFKFNGCDSEVPMLPNSDLHFLDTCVVSSRSVPNNTKKITYYDVEEPNPSFKLITDVNGGYCEPTVNILVGPRNYFLMKPSDDYVSLYFKGILIGQVLQDNFHFFTEDFLVIRNDYVKNGSRQFLAYIFELKQFDERVRDWDGETKQSFEIHVLHYDYKTVSLESEYDVTDIISSNPSFKNCVVHFQFFEKYAYLCNLAWCVNRGSSSTTTMASERLNFPEYDMLDDHSPYLELRCSSSPSTPSVSAYHFVPKYAFNVRENDSSPGKNVHLVHFDL